MNYTRTSRFLHCASATALLAALGLTVAPARTQAGNFSQSVSANGSTITGSTPPASASTTDPGKPDLSVSTPYTGTQNASGSASSATTGIAAYQGSASLTLTSNSTYDRDVVEASGSLQDTWALFTSGSNTSTAPVQVQFGQSIGGSTSQHDPYTDETFQSSLSIGGSVATQNTYATFSSNYFSNGSPITITMTPGQTVTVSYNWDAQVLVTGSPTSPTHSGSISFQGFAYYSAPAGYQVLSVGGPQGTSHPYAITEAPEPSQTAALGLGVLGLAGLALRARRRKARA